MILPSLMSTVALPSNRSLAVLLFSCKSSIPKETTVQTVIATKPRYQLTPDPTKRKRKVADRDAGDILKQ